MGRSALLTVARRLLEASRKSPPRQIGVSSRTFAAAAAAQNGLPDTLKRVGEASAFPNEYPGQNYAFNWSLNADGVTPLKKVAFRITKVLDLKIAGLEQPKKMPLKVKAAAADAMPEAGSENLSFEAFDEVSQRTKDLLSSADALFCPEGHCPGTLTGVRVITNSATLAPQLLAYLDRAPRKFEPESQPITAYVLEGTDEQFAGYAIEEVEEELDDGSLEPKSVASVVVIAKSPDIKVIAKGLELSHAGLEADKAERAAKKAAEKENSS